MIDRKTVGRRIRRLRKISKMTQKELSSCLRVSKVYVSRLENGLDEIDVRAINNVAKIFRCDIGWLFWEREING